MVMDWSSGLSMKAFMLSIERGSTALIEHGVHLLVVLVG